MIIIGTAPRFALYPEEDGYGDGDAATPTAPRTPDYTRSVSCSEDENDMIVKGGGEVGPHYADYNINNLSILDMDDDSIKIEARLEMSGRPSSLPSSRSTPVHARVLTKKKRKPQDWRTKGAYCAVSDAQSSDDTRETPRHYQHIPSQDFYQLKMTSEYQPLPTSTRDTSCAVNLTSADITHTSSPLTSGSATNVLPSEPNSVSSTINNNVPQSLTNNTTAALSNNVSPTNEITSSLSNVSSAAATTNVSPNNNERDVTSSVPVSVTSAVVSKQTIASDLHPPAPDIQHRTKANGDNRQRKETKSFRIGSARRVMEMETMNGEVERPPRESHPHPHPHPHPSHPNPPHPHSAHGPRLLPGRGDPDFGTPV